MLIGLGSGLLLSVVAVIELAALFHHMFIVGVRLRPASVLLLLPFFLIVAGATLLLRSRSQTKSS